MNGKGTDTDVTFPAHTLTADPDVTIIPEGPVPEATGCKVEDVHWETVHALGPGIRALDEVIEETLNDDETWAKTRTDAGADGDALERAMRCIAHTAREHEAHADGPLQWVEGSDGGAFGADAQFTPMVRIPVLGDSARAADLNEALADALAGDDEAMFASMKHRMILFTAGPTTAERAALRSATHSDPEHDVRAQQDRDWIERLMARAPRWAQEGQTLARGIVHPWCYRRAGTEEDEQGWDDPGWRALYRIMVLAIEHWCTSHPKKARRMTQGMTLDAMLWLSYKEKWGSMRWEVHAKTPLPRSLCRALEHTERILECISARMCQRCGRPSYIRKPRQTGDPRSQYGWVNNVCDQCHRRHRHGNREREEVRWHARHDGTERVRDEPPSKAEVDTETDRYLASLEPDHDEPNPWGYAADVVEEWEARKAADSEEQRKRWPGPEVSYGIHHDPAPPKPTTHQVRLGRWRYEEAQATVEALDSEDAAAKARDAEPKWGDTTQVSGAFVLGVDSAAQSALNTELRIEEHYGEIAMLQAVLDERTESTRARARNARQREGESG